MRTLVCELLNLIGDFIGVFVVLFGDERLVCHVTVQKRFPPPNHATRFANISACALFFEMRVEETRATLKPTQLERGPSFPQAARTRPTCGRRTPTQPCITARRGLLAANS
jgi:hypothetical protein